MLKFVDLLHIRNHIEKYGSMEKTHENPLGNFCLMLPIMHGIDIHIQQDPYII